MIRFLAPLFLALTLAAAAPLRAQDNMVWVQVEAHPTLAETRAAIRGFADRLQDVSAFSLSSGWYAIALGPYSRGDAGQVLNVLRSEGAIPRDSYIAFPSAYRDQIWPIGAGVANLPDSDTTPDQDDPRATAGIDPQPGTGTPLDADDLRAALEGAATATPGTGNDTAVDAAGAAVSDAPVDAQAEAIPDETPAEARRSEARLTRQEREAVQVALRWAGVYDAAIDGAFGRGTRAAMAAWQEANDVEATGVLTTRQRAMLQGQYNAVLSGLDLRLVEDTRAGIAMELPMGLLQQDGYQAPFAHYVATDGGPARVVLISQDGDRDTLAGLYDIMQTLQIVPADGERQLQDRSFVLRGANARIVSHTEARLDGGRIKGFTLVWPAGDEDRRTRVLARMQQSFDRLPGVLSVSAGMPDAQRIDLVSGLEIRKPVLSRSGFYVDDGGTVVTTAEVVESCGRITLDSDHEAEVASRDAATGIAVLRPTGRIVPPAAADLAGTMPRLQSEVAVAGYPYGGVLGAPSLTFGQLADLRGLNGEEHLKRLALASRPGDAGGPVFDAGGDVLGMLLPEVAGPQRLPDDVRFAADAAAISRALSAAGIGPRGGSAASFDTGAQSGAQSGAQPGAGRAVMAPEDLTRLASGMTVLVSCWE